MPRKRAVRKPAPVRKRAPVRRRRTKQRGRGLRDTLRKAHDFVKKRRIISGGLSHFGHPKLAKAARQLGYGQAGGARRRGRASKKVRRVPRIMSARSISALKRRAMKGRGRFGEALGGFAGSFLPF